VAVLAVVTAGGVLGIRSQTAAKSAAHDTLKNVVEAAGWLDQEAQTRRIADAAVVAEALKLVGSEPKRVEPLLSRLPSRNATLWLLCNAQGGQSARIGRQDLADSSLCASGPSAALRRLAGVPVEVSSLPLLEVPADSPQRMVVVDEIDDKRMELLSKQVRAEVVIVAGGEILGRTLSATVAQAVVERLPSLAPGAQEIQIGDKTYALEFMPVRSGSLDGRAFLVDYDDMPPITAGWGGKVALAGLGALLLGLPLAWFIHRRFHGSLERLVESMTRAGQGGEINLNFPPLEDAGPEVKRLDRAFRALTANFVASQRDRERSYVEAIGAVVAAIDARDHETTGHSFRVAHYALALARAMNIEGAPLRAIEWGSLLHDVGKIAVPDAILRKPDRLSEEEWFVMRQHPNWGFEMLADVKFLEPALEIVYSHHERWDGSGYPRGLEGEEIPLGARIFAVVDTYDSITSDRPYRRARSHADAVTELCRVAGSQLDPEVVEAFIRIPEAEIRRLRELSEELDLRVRIPRALAEGGELRARVTG
jgi:putative nucleotidyltransferase with HDIG domain